MDLQLLLLKHDIVKFVIKLFSRYRSGDKVHGFPKIASFLKGIMTSRAYFGMQCFWGESAFAKLDGVLKTRVGYAGGKQPDPTYAHIKDHTEVTELVFDDKVVTYDSLLKFFFSHHDPNVHRKTQYRSLILYVDEEQKQKADAALAEILKINSKAETKVEKLDRFYQAEDYHQKYWLRCQPDIFRAIKLSDKELVDTVLAAKINAFMAGYNKFEVLHDLAAKHSLDPALVKKIEAIAASGGDPRACH